MEERQTCRVQEGGQHSREATTFQEPGRPLRNWQEAKDLPVVREDRVWADEVWRRGLSGAYRDLQAIIQSLDLILGEVGNPWKISELCQVRQCSSSYYTWSCASNTIAQCAVVRFQKDVCQVPGEPIGSAWPMGGSQRMSSLRPDWISKWVNPLGERLWRECQKYPLPQSKDKCYIEILVLSLKILNPCKGYAWVESFACEIQFVGQ